MSIEETTPSLVMACNTCNKEFPEGTDVCPDDGTRLVPAVPDQLIGTSFAERYEILEVIGRGGMSVVYKARQKFMNNLVAIKILHPQLSSDPGNFERFQQEAKAAISIRHKNVIQVFDFGVTAAGQAFLIMEYLEGEPLADYLDKHGSMEIERALNIFAQACDGLSQAHKLGIIHRDLKPGNLVLTKEDGENELVKIVDFGIAKLIAPDGSSLQSLTQTGEVFGSPLYMSPEQCQGKPLDARSDIYSLGCVMYETITSMPPLMGINSFETMNKHVKEQPLSLRGIAPEKDIPELIDACVLKALRKDPDRRHQSMAEMKKAIVEGAQKSRINIKHTDGYMPKAFTGETGAQQVVPEIDQDPKAIAAKENKQMQQLVMDAV
ncbi:MAG TPA: serine/threonine-protein kinase, partial [Chroococcales cyanobacterium]